QAGRAAHFGNGMKDLKDERMRVDQVQAFRSGAGRHDDKIPGVYRPRQPLSRRARRRATGLLCEQLPLFQSLGEVERATEPLEQTPICWGIVNSDRIQPREWLHGSSAVGTRRLHGKKVRPSPKSRTGRTLRHSFGRSAGAAATGVPARRWLGVY